MTGTTVSDARTLHRESRWGEAAAAFLAADSLSGLGIDDLELLAEAAQLSGHHQLALATLERVFEERAASGDVEAAVAAAFWLFEGCLFAGEMARGGGWVARATELVGDSGRDPGWLRVVGAYVSIREEHFEEARALLEEARTRARARHDMDLETFAVLLSGRSLLKEGRMAEGLARLDEAMLFVTAARTSPRTTSLLFCAAIGTCDEEAFELGRAQEWSRALEAWMALLPAGYGGPFLDNCRVYRAVLLRRRGEWLEARRELEAAARELAQGPGLLIAGHAYYELGETNRLLGEPDAAEQAYRQASGLGAQIQPGLAELRQAQGRSAAALSGLRRAYAEARSLPDRCRLLPAYVTILLDSGELAEAAEAADELGRSASLIGSSALHAAHERAVGEVALADGRPRDGLPFLRQATARWRVLGEPFETARTTVLVGRGCAALHDDEAATLEWDAARTVLTDLGARTELEQLARLTSAAPAAGETALLTARELEVLGLVTAGSTNRVIARTLFLSERTVHRHVSNILTKLGVGSRTEAATLAIQRGLVRPTRQPRSPDAPAQR